MKENELLKNELVGMELPKLDYKTLSGSDFMLPDSILTLAKQLILRAYPTLNTRKIKNTSYSIANVISADMPLVYVSPGFCRLTGYDLHEVIGKNCRFLQGKDTDKNEVNYIIYILISYITPYNYDIIDYTYKEMFNRRERCFFYYTQLS
jgi:hypothetical protein